MRNAELKQQLWIAESDKEKKIESEKNSNLRWFINSFVLFHLIFHSSPIVTTLFSFFYIVNLSILLFLSWFSTLWSLRLSFFFYFLHPSQCCSQLCLSFRPLSPSPSPSTPGMELELLSELAEPVLLLLSKLGLDSEVELAGEQNILYCVV